MGKDKFESIVTTVIGCSASIDERGNIIPILEINPIYLSRTKVIKYVPIESWGDLENLKPQIGMKIQLIFKNGYRHAVIKDEDSETNELIAKPKECPICHSTNLSQDMYSKHLCCKNPKCGFYDMYATWYFLKYCCSVLELSFRSVLHLYRKGVVKTFLDLDKLTVKALEEIYYKPSDAEFIINKIANTKKIPLQNLYYALIRNLTPYIALSLASLQDEDNRTWSTPIVNIEDNLTIGFNNVSPKLSNGMMLLNKYLKNNQHVLNKVGKRYEIIYPGDRHPLSTLHFVINKIEILNSSYVMDIIKLNGGEGDNRFRNIKWNSENAIIGSGVAANDQIEKAINVGIPVITEEEFIKLLPDYLYGKFLLPRVNPLALNISPSGKDEDEEMDLNYD